MLIPACLLDALVDVITVANLDPMNHLMNLRGLTYG
jgi:hypothetical protein